MDLQNAGKLIAIVGVSIAGLGLLIYLIGRSSWLGRLPGDIRIHGDGVSCVFPIVTMLVISVVLTVLLNIIIRILR